MNDPLLNLTNIACTYGTGKTSVPVFSDINLKIVANESVALVGPSGCGKSSLLHIVGLLDRPTKGEIFIEGKLVNNLPDASINELRMNMLGFVFQFHHLLPEFNALDNVAMPAFIQGRKKDEARTKAAKLLDTMGLSQRHSHRPAELSGGERQRVAIARAVMNNPKLLLADEPTGNLDPATAKQIFAMLINLLKSDSTDSCAMIIATHNMELAQMLDKCLDLTAGVLVQKTLGG